MTGYEDVPADIVAEALDDSIFQSTNQFQRQMGEGDLRGAVFSLLSQNSVLLQVVRYLLLKDEPDEDILESITEFTHIQKIPARP